MIQRCRIVPAHATLERVTPWQAGRDKPFHPYGIGVPNGVAQWLLACRKPTAHRPTGTDTKDAGTKDAGPSQPSFQRCVGKQGEDHQYRSSAPQAEQVFQRFLTALNCFSLRANTLRHVRRRFAKYLLMQGFFGLL